MPDGRHAPLFFGTVIFHNWSRRLKTYIFHQRKLPNDNNAHPLVCFNSIRYMPGFHLTCPTTFSESLNCPRSRLVSELAKLYYAFSLHNWTGHEDNRDLASFKSYGVSCMSIVFCTVLSATKNLEAAAYYGKKAYLYYAEFISQISQDSN